MWLKPFKVVSSYHRKGKKAMKKFTIQCGVETKKGVITRIGKTIVIDKEGNPVACVLPQKEKKKSA
jgi:hypothetical protein